MGHRAGHSFRGTVLNQFSTLKERYLTRVDEAERDEPLFTVWASLECRYLEVIEGLDAQTATRAGLGLVPSLLYYRKLVNSLLYSNS